METIIFIGAVTLLSIIINVWVKYSPSLDIIKDMYGRKLLILWYNEYNKGDYFPYRIYRVILEL
jgi:hypothetical protein